MALAFSIMYLPSSTVHWFTRMRLPTFLVMLIWSMPVSFTRQSKKWFKSFKSIMHDGTDSTIMGVMTGGRKGLDPSYLDFLVQSERVVAIIYNSCSTKSLVRDMEGLMQAFDVADFRSYNFFPGTSYTASLTLLIRKRKTTLVIPVGPAGVGKSTLAAKLRKGGMDISMVATR